MGLYTTHVAENAKEKDFSMSADFEKRLAERGLSLPDAPAPQANYVPYVLVENTVYVSGQI